MLEVDIDHCEYDRRDIDVRDMHIAAPGADGLATKADSVTAFDDFSYGRER